MVRVTIETTYFVGAGASKAFYASLPLAGEINSELLLDRRGLPIGFDDAIARVERYITEQRWPKEKRLIPFEQIYLEFPENLKPLFPRENLAICLFRKLRIEGTARAVVLIPCLERSLSSGQPILTTNYD